MRSPTSSERQRPSLPWRFGVVDDPTPNAFALPGGPIYVTRGMMNLMNSEAELASVLGHDVAVDPLAVEAAAEVDAALARVRATFDEVYAAHYAGLTVQLYAYFGDRGSLFAAAYNHEMERLDAEIDGWFVDFQSACNIYKYIVAREL